ncbi:hypothetical protein BDZ89DRAFT_375816 [Hymenopellis radicata]|nr:hypothetical protein BDZ89DRAFT_375816 [Hymenopellis radicata]
MLILRDSVGCLKLELDRMFRVRSLVGSSRPGFFPCNGGYPISVVTGNVRNIDWTVYHVRRLKPRNRVLVLNCPYQLIIFPATIQGVCGAGNSSPERVFTVGITYL